MDLSTTRRLKRVVKLFCLGCILMAVVANAVLLLQTSASAVVADGADAVRPHLIPPSRSSSSSTSNNKPQLLSNMTLRDYLVHPDGIHLAFAPSFFGFYGYFGALAGIEDELFPDHHEDATWNGTTSSDQSTTTRGAAAAGSGRSPLLLQTIKSVAGASAGAMAAIVLAAGVSPRAAAEFCSTVKLGDFVDFPGILAAFRGDKFEYVMSDFLRRASPLQSLQLEHALVPVAVSGFDLQSMETKIMKRGSMARAARASACFPTLFQPVGWIDGESGDDYLFIDGGLGDQSGLAGLAVDGQDVELGKSKRVVNMVVGDFQWKRPLGPSAMPAGLDASSVLSISIQKLPPCGPLSMSNGPLAVIAARAAMRATLDLPLFLGKEEGHYELHIDASSFIPS